jgi:hypothetical protein
LHILFASLGRKLVFGHPDRRAAKWQGLSGDYNKPANLRHNRHKQVHYRARKPADPAAMRKG